MYDQATCLCRSRTDSRSTSRRRTRWTSGPFSPRTATHSPGDAAFPEAPFKKGLFGERSGERIFRPQAYIKHNNLFLMCVTKRNSNVALVLMYLYRLMCSSSPRVFFSTTPSGLVFGRDTFSTFVWKVRSVFKDYFGELDEESIRDNFVIIYELMDETMDYGYPSTKPRPSKIPRFFWDFGTWLRCVLRRGPTTTCFARWWRSARFQKTASNVPNRTRCAASHAVLESGRCDAARRGAARLGSRTFEMNGISPTDARAPFMARGKPRAVAPQVAQ